MSGEIFGPILVVLYALALVLGLVVALIVAVWRDLAAHRRLERKLRATERLARLTVFTSTGQRLEDIARLEFGTRRREGETDGELTDRMVLAAIADPDQPDCAIWRHRP